VSSIESLEKGFAEFSKDFEGQLDICVPCAGINKNVSFLDTSFQEHQKLIGVNVMGVYHTAQLAAKGSIVLVASIASFMAIRSQMSSAYCGTKGVVRAMCPAIAAELNKYVSRNAASRNEIILTTYVGNQSKFHISGPCENRNDVSRKWILS
jgi:short-subunit dehydrogenase